MKLFLNKKADAKPVEPQRDDDLADAMKFFQLQERFYRDRDELAEVQQCLARQAALVEDLKNLGDLDGAIYVLHQQELLRRELGDRPALQVSLGNQAVLWAERGELERALALHQEEEALCRELGDRSSLQVSLGNQANILLQQGSTGRALSVLEERERICRELDLPEGLAETLGLRAGVAVKEGRFGDAVPLAAEAAELVRERKLDALAESMQPLFSAVEQYRGR